MRLRIDHIPMGKDQGERDGTGVGRPVGRSEARRRCRDRPAPDARRAPTELGGQRRREIPALFCRLRCILMTMGHYGKLFSALFWPIIGPVNGGNLNQPKASQVNAGLGGWLQPVLLVTLSNSQYMGNPVSELIHRFRFSS